MRRRQHGDLHAALSGRSSGVNLAAGDRPEYVQQQRVSAGFFRVLGVPPSLGREFSADEDRPGGPAVAVLSHGLWRRAFGSDPKVIGRIIRLKGEPYTVVGVLPAAAAQVPDALLPLIHTWFTPSWIVRTRGPRPGIAAGIEHAIQTVEPELPIAGFRDMDEVEAGTLADRRFQTTLLTVLAGLALLLSAVGVYGLIASAMAERRRELGIRMALGATVAQAMRTVALPGVLLVAAGVLAGSLLARLTVQTMQHMIWGVRPTDPLTFLGVALLFLLVAAGASFLPALRVARLDPAATLRSE